MLVVIFVWLIGGLFIHAVKEACEQNPNVRHPRTLTSNNKTPLRQRRFHFSNIQRVQDIFHLGTFPNNLYTCHRHSFVIVLSIFVYWFFIFLLFGTKFFKLFCFNFVQFFYIDVGIIFLVSIIFFTHMFFSISTYKYLTQKKNPPYLVGLFFYEILSIGVFMSISPDASITQSPLIPFSSYTYNSP